MPDPVHMCIAIPPKHLVASGIGFLKGKSAIAVVRLNGRERHFTGEHLWARGCAVSTLGFEWEEVRPSGALRESYLCSFLPWLRSVLSKTFVV